MADFTAARRTAILEALADAAGLGPGAPRGSDLTVTPASVRLVATLPVAGAAAGAAAEASLSSALASPAVATAMFARAGVAGLTVETAAEVSQVTAPTSSVEALTAGDGDASPTPVGATAALISTFLVAQLGPLALVLWLFRRRKKFAAAGTMAYPSAASPAEAATTIATAAPALAADNDGSTTEPRSSTPSSPPEARAARRERALLQTLVRAGSAIAERRASRRPPLRALRGDEGLATPEQAAALEGEPQVTSKTPSKAERPAASPRAAKSALPRSPSLPRSSSSQRVRVLDSDAETIARVSEHAVDRAMEAAAATPERVCTSIQHSWLMEAMNAAGADDDDLSPTMALSKI